MTTLATPPSSTPSRRDGPPPSLRDLDLETLRSLYPPKMEPMGEAFIHLRHFLYILGMLSRWFDRQGIDATVFGDINVYYRDERDAVAVVAPDACVVFGIESARIDREGSYFIEREGVVPAFVMEMASGKTARRDMNEKPAIYAQMGVPEYWMLDPTGGEHYGFPIKGLRLVDGAYEEIALTTLTDGSVRGFSDALGLELHWGNDGLRLFDPASSEYLRTPEEIEAAEREAEARVRNAETRAQDAEARARDAEAELARLREKLGI